MATLNPLQWTLHEAAVFRGTAGATATTSQGYIQKDEAVTVTVAVPGGGPVFVHHEKLPVRHLKPDATIEGEFSLLQFDADEIAAISGLTAASGVITFGDASDARLAPQVSWAVVGTDLNGDTIRWDFPYASFSGETAFPLMSRSDPNAYTGLIRAEAKAANYPFMTLGDISATIATGVLAVTKVEHKVKGEGDTTDALTSLSGGSVGDFVTLRPFTTDYLLTLTHGAGVLVMLGAASFVMGGSLNDRSVFEKTGASEWTERERVDPS